MLIISSTNVNVDIVFFSLYQSSIRRIYFSDRLYTEEELPAEFKLFLPHHANATNPAAASTGTTTTATGAVAADEKKQEEETNADEKEKLSTTKKADKSLAEGKEHEEKIEDKENSAENAALPESISVTEEE